MMRFLPPKMMCDLVGIVVNVFIGTVLLGVVEKGLALNDVAEYHDIGLITSGCPR